MTKSERLGVWGGYLGGTIGMCGWLIGFSVWCLAKGHTTLLSEIWLPGLLVSLSLAMVLIVTIEPARRLFGPRSIEMFLALWGGLALAMGLMLLLISHWIPEVAARHPAAWRELAAGGSQVAVPDSVSSSLMGVGLILLGTLAGRLLCATDDS